MEESDWVANISINFFQLVVWNADEAGAFLDWSKTHTLQGFVWRPGSAAFATLFALGKRKEVEQDGHSPLVRVQLREQFILSQSAIRIIKVPFSVSSGGIIVTSPGSYEVHCSIPPDTYALYYLIEPDDEATWIDPHAYTLVFVPAREAVEASIIRADARLHPPAELVMTGELAWDGTS